MAWPLNNSSRSRIRGVNKWITEELSWGWPPFCGGIIVPSPTSGKSLANGWESWARKGPAVRGGHRGQCYSAHAGDDQGSRETFWRQQARARAGDDGVRNAFGAPGECVIHAGADCPDHSHGQRLSDGAQFLRQDRRTLADHVGHQQQSGWRGGDRQLQWRAERREPVRPGGWLLCLHTDEGVQRFADHADVARCRAAVCW